MLTLFALSTRGTASIWSPLSAFSSLEISGILDLVGLAVAVWTVWASLSLPVGGQCKRSYRSIAWGTLAFALCYLLDSLLQGTQMMTSSQSAVLTEAAVLASMLLFVWGLMGMAEALPAFAHQQASSFDLICLLVVDLAIAAGALSFIFSGFTAGAVFVALFGLDAGLLIMTGVCVALLIRARLGGIFGRSLWLAMLGLLLFSLAHPLHIWLVAETDLSAGLLAILHRGIVIPALLLFALSITRLARQLHQTLIPGAPTAQEPQEEPQEVIVVVSARARAHRRQRLTAGTGGW
jgi:hypothetical protein